MEERWDADIDADLFDNGQYVALANAPGHLFAAERRLQAGSNG